MTRKKAGDNLRGAALIAHGGGPTHVINASLAGVFDECRQHREVTALYGARNGVVGVLEESFLDLDRQEPGRIAALGRTTGSALGSCRRNFPEDAPERILDVFRAHNIRFFFYNGGNGSMHTARQVVRFAREANYELRVIGIPKTIDNDLAETDHSPGYGSAARFVACAFRDMGGDNRALPSPIEVVETMGREVGWIAAASVLARNEPDDAPHLIYLPERRLPKQQLLADVESVYRRLGRAVIAVCEGQLDETGDPFDADRALPHSFEYRMTGNLGHMIAEFITKNLKLRSRSSKPRLLGRSSAPFVSETDRAEAYECGRTAVRAAVDGQTDRMVTLLREPGPEYRCATGLAPLEKIAGVDRRFPQEWIHPGGNDVLPAFRDYALPLAGEIEPRPQLEEILIRRRIVDVTR